MDSCIEEDAGNGNATNMGIAIVVPADSILEVLNQPIFKEKCSQEIERIRAEINSPVLD